MAVETSLGATTAGVSPQSKPRFMADEVATPQALATYLNKMAQQNYHLLSLTPISQTNHFNKDFECTVWVVVELDRENSGYNTR